MSKTLIVILEDSLFFSLPNKPIFHEVIEYMVERDFVVYDIWGVLRRPLDGAVAQVGVCFVKGDGALHQSKQWA